MNKILLLLVVLFISIPVVAGVTIGNGTYWGTTNINTTYYMADDLTVTNITVNSTWLNINGGNMTVCPVSGPMNVSLEFMNSTQLNFTTNTTASYINIENNFGNYSILNTYNYSLLYQINSTTYQSDIASDYFINFTSILSSSWYLLEGAATGVLYNTNISDTITITDYVTITKTTAGVNYSLAEPDTITISDGVNITKTIAGGYYNTSELDIITITDSVLISKTVSGSNYSTDGFDTIIFSDYVQITKNTSITNNDAFNFTNSSISPTAVRENDPFTVTVDINDSDGTISTAIVKISSTNYTMINTVGDTWSYTFTSTSVPTTYYIQTIYAQDDFGAWNSTSISLSIDAVSSTGTGSSGGISPIITPTPTTTPEPIIEEIEEEPTDIITNISNTIEVLIFPYKTTILRVNLKTDDRLYIKEMLIPNMTECTYTPEIIHRCVVKDEVIRLTVNFDPDTAGLLYIHDNHIKLYDGTNNYHTEFDMYVINLMASINIPENNLNNPSKLLFSSNEYGTISGVRIWWPLVLLVLFVIYSKKKK